MGLPEVLIISTLVTVWNICTDLAVRVLVYKKKNIETQGELVAKLQRQVKYLEAEGKKKSEKQIEILKKELSGASAKQGMAAMPATFISALSVMVLLWVLSSFFAGYPIATLPFEPTTVMGIRGMFQRSLPDDITAANPRAASYLFVFIMSNGLSRWVISKVAPDLSGAPKGAAAGGFQGLMDQMKSQYDLK